MQNHLKYLQRRQQRPLKVETIKNSIVDFKFLNINKALLLIIPSGAEWSRIFVVRIESWEQDSNSVPVSSHNVESIRIQRRDACACARKARIESLSKCLQYHSWRNVKQTEFQYENKSCKVSSLRLLHSNIFEFYIYCKDLWLQYIRWYFWVGYQHR